MCHGGVGEDGQLSGTPDAIVCAEGGAPRPYPIAIDIGLDGIVHKVVRGGGVLFTDHVHMALKDNRSPVFHPRCSALAHKHVAHGVAVGLDAKLLPKIGEVLADLFFVLRRARYLANLNKVPPQLGGL